MPVSSAPPCHARPYATYRTKDAAPKDEDEAKKDNGLEVIFFSLVRQSRYI